MGSYEVLVAAADRALYMAKHAGRDRVEVIREGAKRVSQPGAAPPKSSDEATRVFVVHDDPNERDAIVEALKGHGYAVEAPASAHEAAQRLLRGSERVDLLITSLILPRVSGFALVEQLSATAPELRVIYLADGMRQRVSWVGVPGTVARFVAKPVDTKALADTVREVLAEPAPAAGGFETQSAAAPGPR
jgi:PleD family two-component response regulator